MKITMLLGLALITALFATSLQSKEAMAADIQFHFYGAEDCPPCMAFKRDHLADVQDAGATHGFTVAANIIPRTLDVPVKGVFGEGDPILRTALTHGGRAYPPIFFVSRNDRVVSVHAHDWEAALNAVIDLTS